VVFPNGKRDHRVTRQKEKNRVHRGEWRTGRCSLEGALARQHGLATKAPALRFMNLDQFHWNEASLKAGLRLLAWHLAQHVRLNWQSVQSIGSIRLVGHTDSSGFEKYNVNLPYFRGWSIDIGGLACTFE
jgi:outer membrane protein OmpA-like peptidoglycan-associated protein